MLLCAGEAFEDLIFHGLDRLPELGEEVKTDRFTSTIGGGEVKTDRFTSTIGGGAVITAVNAARLGMKTQLVSALGDNAMAVLKKEKVGVTNLRQRDEPHAITAALSTEDDRAFVTFNGVNTQLDARLAKIFSRKLSAGSQQPKHVHFCFYPHDCSQWKAIVARMRKNNVTTSWDFGWNEPLTNDRGLADLIDALDFVFINAAEAILYTGSATLEESIPHWRQRQAVTIIKLGSQGAVWLAPDRDLHVRARKVKAVDTTGAGDAFNAGFLVGWMRGKSPKDCLALGNTVGAESTKRAGGI